MIYVGNKIYAKVWAVKKFDKYMDLRVSTSEKDREGNHVNSTWFPRLIGHAFNSLKDTLKEGDRIVINKAKLTNELYTNNEGVTKSALKFLVYDAEVQDSSETPEAAAPAPAAPSKATSSGDSCPW